MDWLRGLLFRDAPRFCPECGKAIVVRRADRYDEQTGENTGIRYWTCPDDHIDVDLTRGEITRRAGQQHVWGYGVPRWAERESTEPAE